MKELTMQNGDVVESCDHDTKIVGGTPVCWKCGAIDPETEDADE